MMMALAEIREKATILVPGGVTLSPTDGEDAGKAQSVGIRFAQGEIDKEKAEEIVASAAPVPPLVEDVSFWVQRLRHK